MASPTPLVCRWEALAGSTPRPRATLRPLVCEIRELADGYALRVVAGASQSTLAATLLALGRACPTLRVQLWQVAHEGALWLKLTGPEGVKPFLHAELGLD